MLTVTISGSVSEQETSIGLPGLRVQVCDRESRYADLLRSSCTGLAGRFEITSTPPDFRDFLEIRPDLYLKLFSPGAEEPFFISEQPVRS